MQAQLFEEAVSHHRGGRLSDAERGYRQVLAIAPQHADALHLLGLIALQVWRNDAALDLIGQAIEVKPDAARFHSNRGMALNRLGRNEEAVEAHDAALRLDPDDVAAHSNRAIALNELGRLEEATASCNAALSRSPNHAEALCNLGSALKDMGRLDDAIAAHEKALRVRPELGEARLGLSMARLLKGDLRAAWPDYEARWGEGRKFLPPRHFDKPLWRGEDISGRTILLHAEQGLGDTIQFSRYAALVAERGARVVVEAPRSVLRLLRGLAGVDQLVAAGSELPHFDYHCPLMSLPGVFATALDTIPAPSPYLTAEPDRIELWRGRLGTSGFKVGIVWQGDPAGLAERGRSAPLAAFAELAAITGVRLISLQRLHGLGQLLRLPAGVTIEELADLDGGPDAFIDTAAVMMNLDLIISVDTAIGHLAGALGRPTWLALQKAPHWVWMLEREDSPWYPHHRLFRQDERGDWRGVAERMQAELRGIVAP